MNPGLEEISYLFALSLGMLATLAGTYSIVLGRRYERQVRDVLSRPKNGFHPRARVIMPCKGNESGLVNNIEAILNLDYPAYSVTIVTDSITDPVYETAISILKDRAADAKVCISQPHPEASGKVSALLTALEDDHGESEVFAFVDSDSRVASSWLSNIVDPLFDSAIGPQQVFDGIFPRKVASGLMCSPPGTRLERI